LPSLIASLLVHRQQNTTIKELKEMIDLVFPYIAHELSIRGPAPTQLALTALKDQGMIKIEGMLIHLPEHGTEQNIRLGILANLMSETLGRMYLVLYFAKQGNKSRQALSLASEYSAEKISLLLGINGPEFFEQKLIGVFLDQLIDLGLLETEGAEVLQPRKDFMQLHNAIESAIDTQLKYAINAE